MSILYRVSGSKIHFSDPLHVRNFYPDVQRVHRRMMSRRQDLILYLANLHSNAVKSGMPLGMIQIPIRLSSLREWVLDFRVVFDEFFEIHKLGYDFGDGNFSPSIVTPKNISSSKRQAAERTSTLEYVPPPLPDNGSISKVYILQKNKDQILERITLSSRLDLLLPCKWLLERPEVNFHFERSGKLQQRDTSIWPIKGIETWPSWLREMLFGPGVDIDSAYTQFLVQHLKHAYIGREHLLTIIFPDLMRMITEKPEWRRELCEDVLKLEHTEENIGHVKRICMSLANGSKISPGILLGGSAFSVTGGIVLQATPDTTPEHLIRVGERLQRISAQYTKAKKIICLHLLRTKGSRVNQKRVFGTYFEWERIARHSIWESCDRHGIMVHDGIEGIPEEYLKNMPSIMKELNIQLTRG